jgi:hypothetical protein
VSRLSAPQSNAARVGMLMSVTAAYIAASKRCPRMPDTGRTIDEMRGQGSAMVRNVIE